MSFLSRSFAIAVISLCASVVASGQRPGDVLATSNSLTYKVDSLSPAAQKLYLEQRKLIAEERSRLLSKMIEREVLEIEARLLNTTPEKLLEAQRAKAVAPTQTEIQRVYDANRERLGGATLDQVRPQIIEFLKADAGETAVEKLVAALRVKHKVLIGKDVNQIGLAPTDPLATVGTRVITAGMFETENRFSLHDVEMHFFDEISAVLESAIFSAVASEEAKGRNLDVGSFIAVEVTDKLREFTDEERAAIEDDLMRRLFKKYNVKILLPEPRPIVHSVSTDDDPASGNASAPVTVIMFTDYQCPSCKRIYPVLRKVIAENGDKIRFVVRDFPLEMIHKDAFNAALAANAARAQGKYAEYTELLYRNQDALDRPSLVRYATELGLNVKQFELDFSDAKTAAEVRKDQADGRSHGVGGTPAIFVNGVKVHRLSVGGVRTAVGRALVK